MQLLYNDPKYFFTNKETFINDLDNVNTFVMKNYEIGMHMQEFFELNIITNGKGKHYIEENIVDAEIGDVFIIPPNVSHGYTGGEGFDVFHVLLNDKFIEKNMNELQMLPSFFILFTAEPLIRAKTERALHLKLNGEQFKIVHNMLNQALTFIDRTVSFNSVVRCGFALALIAFLCKAYTENNNLKIESSTDTGLLKAISYIHENYHKKLTIDELSEIAHISRSSFVHKFKEICKMTPLDYITQRRIDAAEYMLFNTKFSLMDIAFKCGFYDAAHFSRTFVRAKGKTPAEYRKEI